MFRNPDIQTALWVSGFALQTLWAGGSVTFATFKRTQKNHLFESGLLYVPHSKRTITSTKVMQQVACRRAVIVSIENLFAKAPVIDWPKKNNELQAQIFATTFLQISQPSVPYTSFIDVPTFLKLSQSPSRRFMPLVN